MDSLRASHFVSPLRGNCYAVVARALRAACRTLGFEWSVRSMSAFADIPPLPKKKRHQFGALFFRKRRDSNPRSLAGRLFSKQMHSATLPLFLEVEEFTR